MINDSLTKFLPYVHEFIQNILEARVEIKFFIIYGSIVAEELTKTSDIDVRIAVLKKYDIRTVEKIKDDINKKLKKAGYKNYLHAIINTEVEPEYLADGILLYGKPIVYQAKKEGLAEKMMITYNTTNIPKNNVAKMSIKLFGQELKRGKKTYKRDGVVSICGAKRLRNAILVNEENIEIILNIFNEFKIPFKTKKIYLGFGEFIEK